jgi:hypothetical protein
MKTYLVTKIEQVHYEILVQAENEKQAREIAQMEHVPEGKGNVIDADFVAYEHDEPIIGRSINTVYGYIDPQGNKHNVVETADPLNF